jgi:hypothetical protein
LFQWDGGCSASEALENQDSIAKQEFFDFHVIFFAGNSKI